MIIYRIFCKNTECNYVGASINPGNRFNVHIKKLKNKSHPSLKMKNDFAQYGIGSFGMQIIEQCELSKTKERENYWISYYNAGDKSYNLRGSDYNFKKIGKKHSEETKAKIKKSCIGKKGRVLTREESIRITSLRDMTKIRKKIINLTTGQKFNSLAECAKFYKISYQAIYGSIKTNGTCIKCKFAYL